MKGKIIKFARTKKLRNVLALTLVFGILAGVLGVVSSRPVAAQPSTSNATDERHSTPVSVVNTPLPVTGTLGVSGNVGINGTVRVSNPGTTTPVPLVVSDTSSPGRTPFQTLITRTTVGFTSFDVPSDKRFVVEFVSGRCTSPQALTVAAAEVFTQVGSSGALPHDFVPQLVFAGLSNAYTFSQQTRIYADGGTTVYLTIDSAGTGVAECSATLSGYLENQS